MNTIFSKETSDGKPLMPKVVTCQDLEFEFFMKFEVDNIQRCSTPVNKEEENEFEELDRTKEHFRNLILSMALPAQFHQTPIKPALTSPTQGFYKCSSITVMLNRLSAEIARKQTFSSIYSGPISNSYAMRKRF